MANKVFILGGYQTDFSRNITREGLALYDLFHEVLNTGLAQTQLNAEEIQVGHVGNFVSELYTGQAHLGGFFAHVDLGFLGMPAARHEAACASGSIAILAAMADIEAGRYDAACVLGIEVMRNVKGDQAAEYLRPAAWADKEAMDTALVWPNLFSRLVEEYDQRYGIDAAHLAAISAKNFANGRKNPNAQARIWQFNATSFTANDEHNPLVFGRLRKQDCGQISDGAAVIFLANEEKARAYARRMDVSLESIPYIKGWGHRTAMMLLEDKLAASQNQEYIFPQVKHTFDDAFRRAQLPGMAAIDGLETHDCFNITEYMAIDHSGLTPAGQAYRAIEDGTVYLGGKLPINASGGLIGLGHPVGATGVRMLLDCYKQVTANAGDYQINGAKTMMAFNVGGSATTCCSFIVGK